MIAKYINNEGSTAPNLTPNKIYDIIKEEDELFYLKNDTGHLGWANSNRFEIIKENSKENPPLYDNLYERVSFKEFREIMELTTRGYLDFKNEDDRLDDLDQAIETLLILRDYELKEKRKK